MCRERTSLSLMGFRGSIIDGGASGGLEARNYRPGDRAGMVVAVGNCAKLRRLGSSMYVQGMVRNTSGQ